MPHHVNCGKQACHELGSHYQYIRAQQTTNINDIHLTKYLLLSRALFSIAFDISAFHKSEALATYLTFPSSLL